MSQLFGRDAEAGDAFALEVDVRTLFTALAINRNVTTLDFLYLVSKVTVGWLVGWLVGWSMSS